MSLKDVTRAPDAVGIATQTGDLRRFLEPKCAATIWQRTTPGQVQRWLDQLPVEQLPKGRVIAPAQAVGSVVTALCDGAALPSGAERTWLERDIAALSEAFATLMDSPYLRLRLDVVTTNACRRFHVDAITARLVCTYRGTGTQYGYGVNGSDPSEVHTVAAGSAILMRGTKWPAHPASGLLHRSPPIEGTGETRLVLVLDPVMAPEDEFDFGSTRTVRLH